VVVPVGVEDEKIRRSFGGGPRNFSTDPSLEARYRTALEAGDWTEVARLYRRIQRTLRFHHHMSAIEARALLPRDFWDGALKFAVDRHPYEKAVSLAHWRARTAPPESAAFTAWLDTVVAQAEYRNYGLYSENGTVIVNRVLRYENLAADLAGLAAGIGFTWPADLPRAKSQHRRDRTPAREVLTPAQRCRIRDVCAEEFELLGYDA
jgi:hypothetical protein